MNRIYLNELIFVLFVREENICKHKHLSYFMLFLNLITGVLRVFSDLLASRNGVI